jgi:hypothetical protein
MSLAAKKFQDDEFLFITAGGFDGEDKDKAFLVSTIHNRRNIL